MLSTASATLASDALVRARALPAYVSIHQHTSAYVSIRQRLVRSHTMVPPTRTRTLPLATKSRTCCASAVYAENAGNAPPPPLLPYSGNTSVRQHDCSSCVSICNFVPVKKVIGEHPPASSAPVQRQHKRAAARLLYSCVCICTAPAASVFVLLTKSGNASVRQHDCSSCVSICTFAQVKQQVN
jgi:hypothetical protein